MKLKFTYTFFTLSLLVFLFTSSSGGRAGAANTGNTGAPGDEPETCVTCHGNNAAIQVTANIDIADADGNSIAANGYVPGSTYDVTVRINAEQGSPAGFGFQLLCLNAEEGQDGPEATAWSDPGGNVQIRTASMNANRNYAEHQGVQGNGEFKVKWTAPAEGSGVVTFYSCGNGVNGNGTTAGDNAACTTLSLSENTTTSTRDLEPTLSMSILPNPVVDQFALQTFSPEPADFQLSIYNLMGQAMFQQQVNIQQGTSNNMVNVDHLQPGIYLLQMEGKNQRLTKQLVKL